MFSRSAYWSLTVALVAVPVGALGAYTVTEVRPPFACDPSNLNSFSTPLAYYNGSLYHGYVQSPNGPSTRINMQTTVAKGTPNASGVWQWTSTVVEPRTMDDAYHAQPSVGVDKNGYIHVAYNMHNMPWQYSVSTSPQSITSFTFRGDPITQYDLEQVKWYNRTSFPSFGSAAIPGNQVTYPAFFNDRNQDLYVTYRYAVRPKRAWADRWFAGAIARYNTSTGLWAQLGGNVTVTLQDANLLPLGTISAITRPFALQDQWAVYQPRLDFDSSNRMHITWLWREGGAGSDTSHPSYAYSTDGGVTLRKGNNTAYVMPIPVAAVERSDSGSIGYAGYKYYPPVRQMVDSAGNPWVLHQRINLVPTLARRDPVTKKWSSPEIPPANSLEAVGGPDGSQWAVASGPKVFRRSAARWAPWTNVYTSSGYCYAKMLPVWSEQKIFIELQSCDRSHLKILQIRTVSG